MALVALLAGLTALGLALWCVSEITGLKERWARLYGLKSAMVETEISLQRLMGELDSSGQAIIGELEARLASAVENSEEESAKPRESEQGQKPQAPNDQQGSSTPAIDLADEMAGKTRAVLRLARQGCTVQDIAARLNLPRGEVQLVLDLEQFRQ